jgi:hypothetical protein
MKLEGFSTHNVLLGVAVAVVLAFAQPYISAGLAKFNVAA